MSSKVGIVNLALSHLASDKGIATLTEASKEAVTARVFYDIARDATLRGFPWPFATKFAVLSLVSTEPTTEWAYSYRYPSDCLRLHRILSGIRNDDRQSRVSYRMVGDSVGQLIYTDEQDAEIEYTTKNDNVASYPADFELAFSLYLAVLMAPRLTAGDQFKLGEKAFKQYKYQLSIAAAAAVNEEQVDEIPQAEWIRDRS